MNRLATAALIIIASTAMLAPVQAGGMKKAKEHTEKALEALQEKAASDKGGHRVAAMKLLKEALAQIEAGVKFDQENVSKNEGKKKGK